MKTTKGKLRNMTTGIMHTSIGDVYEFIEQYTRMAVMTHQIPSVCRALLPILKRKLSEEWFPAEWVKVGLDEVIEISDLTSDETKEFQDSYSDYASKMWDSIKDKTIIVKS